MVVIHVKADEDEEKQFVYECPCATTIDDLAEAVVEIADLQSKIQALSLFLRRHFLTDALREGNPDLAVTIDRTLWEAESYASKDQVLHKKALSARLLRDHVRSIEREALVARSMGLMDSQKSQLLPEHWSIRKHDQQQGCDPLGSAKLLWAGKELSKGKRLSDYIGENEKTKIIINLKPASSC